MTDDQAAEESRPSQIRNRSTHQYDHYVYGRLKEVKTELVTMKDHVNMLGLDLVDTNNKIEQLEWKLECCEHEMELQVP